MKMTLQLVVCEDDGREETITDVVILEKTCQQREQVGLTLAEAKTLLQRLQQLLVEQQAAAFVATRVHCQACGALLSIKGHHALTFRTLFGIVRLTSPRLCHCPCTPHETATCSPLTELLSEHTAPELLFMETKWASLVSYGLTVQALTDFLPIDETLSVSTVRTNALAVAQRCETVLQQTAKGLPDQIRDDEEDYPLRDPVVQELERLQWFLWHGNVYKALQVVQSVEMDLDAAVATSRDHTARKLLRAVEEFHTYIENNQGFIPNYGERYRNGERISTGFVESTVNQVISKRFCKKQLMPWTKRAAHLLLQMRVKTLNHELATVFRRWYSNFPVQQGEARAA